MIDFTQIEALVFDCYGTLIDWESGILAALREVRSRHAIEMGDEAVLAAFGRLEAQNQNDTPTALYPAILAAVYRDLADEWDIPPDDGDAEAFAATVGDWPEFDDTKVALNALTQRFSLNVLSNVDNASFARSKERLGVEFDEVMTAEDIGSYKPDRRNFEYAIRKLADRGIEKAKIVHVAQSLYHDHVPAQSFGLQTVFVDRRVGKAGSGATIQAQVPVEPDLTVQTLDELVRLAKAE